MTVIHDERSTRHPKRTEPRDVSFEFWVDEVDGLWEVTATGTLDDVMDKASRTLPVPANFTGWVGNMAAAWAETFPIFHPYPDAGDLDSADFDRRRARFRQIAPAASSAAFELLPAHWRILNSEVHHDRPGWRHGYAETIWIDKHRKCVWIMNDGYFDTYQYTRLDVRDDFTTTHTRFGTIVITPDLNEELLYTPVRPAPVKH